MALTDALKALCGDTARSLHGRARRICLARTGQALGPGGQRRAARARGWNRGPRRQGMQAGARGWRGLEACTARGRTRAAHYWPHVLAALTALVASPRQTAPQLRTTRRDPRGRAAAVRRQRIALPGDTEATRPTGQPSTTTLQDCGDWRTQVATRQPPQKACPRGPLRPGEAEPSGGRRRPGRLTGRTRRPGARHAWPLGPGRAAPWAGRRRRARVGPGGDGPTRGALPAPVGGMVCGQGARARHQGRPGGAPHAGVGVRP
jgi:hypothetical protein